jgi:hypothetical protein
MMQRQGFHPRGSGPRWRDDRPYHVALEDRYNRLQSGAAAQADSGGLLMAEVPGFAKVFAGRSRIVEMDIGLRLRTLLSSSTAC